MKTFLLAPYRSAMRPITGAHAAAHILLVCRTERGSDKHRGLSMISVPAGADGLEVRPIETMGGREVNDVFFTDCFVLAERLVGGDGEGWPRLPCSSWSSPAT